MTLDSGFPHYLQITTIEYFKNKYGYLMIENIGQASVNARFYDKNGTQLDSVIIDSNR
jgi:hypothetical protein